METQNNTWKVRFFTIWLGQAFSLISSELVQFALVWWLTDHTQSGTVLGISSMIALLPEAICGPFVGALVDRWDRRRTMMLADTTVALASLGLALLFLGGTPEVGFIYLLILVRAFGQVFHSPAMLASTSLLVPASHLNKIAGINQTWSGFIMIAAPPLGALLLNLLPLHTIMITDIVGALIAVLPLLFISIPQPQTDTQTNFTFQEFKRSVADGFRYLKRWRGAINMLVISTLVNFLSRPAFQLLSLLATKRFYGDEGSFALLAAAMGGGVVVGGILISAWGGFKRRMLTSLFGILGMGAAILVMGLTPSSAFEVAVGAIFVGGAMMPVCMSPIEALIQNSVEPSMQGRVFMLMKSASTIVSPISLALAGILSDSIGIQSWYIGAGILILFVGLAGFMSPRVLNLGAMERVPQRLE